MPTTATIEDVVSIAKVQALQAGKKLLAITVSDPRYVPVPDEDDPDSVLEFVVDIQLLDGVTQAIAIGSSQGLRVIENVLVAREASGDALSSIHTPVEVEKSSSGQLQVVGRAKVQLPTLSSQEYSYASLGLDFVAELDVTDDGLQDPFGAIVDPSDASLSEVQVGFVTEFSSEHSTLEELALDSEGNFVGLGVNPLQRVIHKNARHWTVRTSESASAADTIGIS